MNAIPHGNAGHDWFPEFAAIAAEHNPIVPAPARRRVCPECHGRRTRLANAQEILRNPNLTREDERWEECSRCEDGTVAEAVEDDEFGIGAAIDEAMEQFRGPVDEVF